jgi:hypothetical protein
VTPPTTPPTRPPLVLVLLVPPLVVPVPAGVPLPVLVVVPLPLCGAADDDCGEVCWPAADDDAEAGVEVPPWWEAVAEPAAEDDDVGA